ncbi:39S ribosomal protein L18, mitochondrial [Schistosoma japonicum]|uniref:Large ribosomal subunit protein uL18m n=1 Tax=Schistosoma japonicum TaxID=6182 RepID=C1LN19_SCHJA|nr:39S ribosomal protein L18, mitochondrial [Schistosoma japonicum]KAH8860898.1 39S ribosomal protein L18, mitochondrial [Schistosoma japonicum]KAH8860899.1 39S ribosomal protein L18, mitochondrial [Schistosoma japonicum]KAH8860900.1 39S ribosomal protein L18, mitochondrial [Schistosoma japonicum]KAH8860901.1 39S ribosomal protein L18, mitochondrial [Schistosoma japonicum]
MSNSLLISYVFSYIPTKLPLRMMSTLVYRNKNPRNLELLGMAPKTKGWELQAPRKDFWNKVVLDKGSHHTTGLVIHTSSKVLVSASTKEISIRKHLYSCTDVSAAENIGRVLAFRCQQCCLVELFSDASEISEENESTRAFYESLLAGGIQLRETPYIEKLEGVGIDYDSMSNEEKRAMYPSLIETLRTTPDWDSIPYPYSLRPKAGKAKLKNNYQILSKIRQGMVWDPFYSRMVLPQNKAYWQHEYEESRKKKLESLGDSNKSEEPVEVIVPAKWQLT